MLRESDGVLCENTAKFLSMSREAAFRTGVVWVESILQDRRAGSHASALQHVVIVSYSISYSIFWYTIVSPLSEEHACPLKPSAVPASFSQS